MTQIEIDNLKTNDIIIQKSTHRFYLVIKTNRDHIQVKNTTGLIQTFATHHLLDRYCLSGKNINSLNGLFYIEDFPT